MNVVDNLQISKKMGYLWVVLPDAINMDSNPEIEKLVELQIEDKQNVVLDLSETRNVFSSGLGLMIRLRRMASEKGGALCLVNVSRRIKDMMVAFNLDKVFPIYTTEIEFEISQDDVWQQKKREHEFLFLAQIENGVYRINLSGQMIRGNNLDRCKEFNPQFGITVCIFDLSGLDMIDSVSLAVFNSMIDRIYHKGGVCRAFGADEVIADLLVVVGVHEKLSFYKNERLAIEGF